MDRIASLVSILVLAVAASEELNQLCNDPVMCVNKPAMYDSLKKIMVEGYFRDKKLLNKIHRRIRRDPQEESLKTDDNCEETVEKHSPYVLKSGKRRTSDLILVQLPELNFRQELEYVKCTNNGVSCFDRAFYFNSPARCKEKISTISLFIFDQIANKTDFKPYEIPVACECKFP